MKKCGDRDVESFGSLRSSREKRLAGYAEITHATCSWLCRNHSRTYRACHGPPRNTSPSSTRTAGPARVPTAARRGGHSWPPTVRCLMAPSAGRPSSPAAPSRGAFLLRFGHVDVHVLWPRLPLRLGASMVWVGMGRRIKMARPPTFRDTILFPHVRPISSRDVTPPAARAAA